jgi:hypothetical protein
MKLQPKIGDKILKTLKSHKTIEILEPYDFYAKTH